MDRLLTGTSRKDLGVCSDDPEPDFEDMCRRILNAVCMCVCARAWYRRKKDRRPQTVDATLIVTTRDPAYSGVALVAPNLKRLFATRLSLTSLLPRTS